MNPIIFVISNNTFQLSKFVEYYNILNQETNQELHFMLDDRDVSRAELLNAIETDRFNHQHHFVTDMLEALNPLFEDCKYYDWILNKAYKVSVKLLPFIYANHFLGIDKSMLMDGDTLFLQPIDKWFENDYVRRTDALSSMSIPMCEALAEVLPDLGEANISALNGLNKRLTSGTFIYTYSDKLLADVKAFFNSQKIYDLLFNAYKPEHKRKFSGVLWTIEQCFYSMHLHSINKYADAAEFGQLVRYEKEPKDVSKIKSLRFLPTIIHFFAIDKKPGYDYHEQVIKKYLEKL